jgi:MFS family permease
MKTIPSDGSPISFLSLPRLVWILGFMMFLVNLSYLMIYSYVGIYMKNLGMSLGWIGIIEGVVEAASYLMKLFSGIASDFLQRRKPVIMTGYAMMLIARIIIGFSYAISPIFVARLLERIGTLLRYS